MSESICCGPRLLNLRRHHQRMTVNLRHHHQRMGVNLHHHQSMTVILHHWKDGNLLVRGWMVFFESFVPVAHRDSDSSAGHSDSEPQALSYLPATRSCFLFVASCCLAEPVDKHFPGGRNIRKVVAIHWKSYSRWPGLPAADPFVVGLL